jgi:hypothetical protein
MLTSIQLITLFLLALTVACAVGHALEFPGKLRLSKETYLATQPIYYPGFTVVGGIAEVLAVPMLGMLAILTPRETPAFALTLGALLCQVALQLVFWFVTQPVNKHWLNSEQLGRAGRAFFGTARNPPLPEWTALRNRWEWSHVARGLLAMAALMLLASAAALDTNP